MRILVTGSADHLGERLARTLHQQGQDVLGLDLLASHFSPLAYSVGSKGYHSESFEEGPYPVES